MDFENQTEALPAPAAPKRGRGRPSKNLAEPREETVKVASRLEISDRPVPEPATEAQYVVSEKVIDDFTIKRTLVKIGPETCRFCGFDICKRNNMPPYAQCTAMLQAQILQAMKDHYGICMMAKRRPILESNKPTQWLTSEDEAKTLVTD